MKRNVSHMFFRTKAIFFDIGGVVVDADLHSYAEIGAKIYQTKPENIQKAATHLVPDLERGKMSSHNFWKLIETSLWSLGIGKPSDFPDLDSIWNDILGANVKVNFEVLEIAQKLRERYTIGVLSNAIKDHVLHLNDLKIYDGFDPVIVSCQVGMRKPEPAIYKLAAKKAGVWTRQCFFIDDLEENCVAAKKVGMKAHRFTTASNLEADLRKQKLL